MKVAVLEGDFAQLSAMGLPLAVVQQSNLKLEGALWTAKCSGSCFSVSLFWPSSASPVSVPAKRRRRRKRKKSKVGGSGGGKQLAEKQSGSEQPPAVSPIDAHCGDGVDHEDEVIDDSTTEFASCDEEVELAKCDKVVYEKRDGVAGVQYRKDGEEGWTPVTRRRRKVRPRRNSDVCIPDGAAVMFKKLAGTPGLSVRTRRTRKWVPIASRTRSRLKY